MKRVPKPSPALVVALLALVLAVAGTATAALTGKDKSKVRNIADQEIAKAAPGLSVLSATNATNASNAANASNATNATNATNAANASSAANAAALGGLPPAGYVESFGGRIQPDVSTGVMFTVPQLQVSILPDSSPASSADFRVRNDSSGTVAVTDTKERLGGTLFTVAAGATSPDESPAPGQMAITAAAHPDLVLLFGCFSGVADAYCVGQLMSTPAR
jgi:hypothetical protein